ncbi:hypothetical protein WME75_04615 [Sorangium sp. So ce1014]|uniref:hypothetical protein n=1 Tax=Sorangium sp. So ce1014 TaxID=3133326 RepID=UPI003F617331
MLFTAPRRLGHRRHRVETAAAALDGLMAERGLPRAGRMNPCGADRIQALRGETPMLRHRLHLLTLSSALVLMSARTALAAGEAQLIVTSPRLGEVARPTLHLDITCTSGGSVVCTGIEVTILNYRGEYLQLSRSTQDRRSVDPMWSST